MRRTSRRAVSSPPVALLALLSAALASPSPGATYRVGAGGPPCTYATIPDALVAAGLNAGPDEILVANNQTYTNVFLELFDWSPDTLGTLSIRGGYDDCADDVAGVINTAFHGGAGNPVIHVGTIFEPTSEITLSGLLFQDSGVDGVLIDFGGRVTMENVGVLDNGGTGILVENGGEAYVDAHSGVGDNGNSGIACASGSTVDLAGIAYSNTGVSGGGIAASSGCQVHVRSSAGVLGNHATSGGGIYAESGAIIDIDGTNPPPNGLLQILHNTASGSGGGIYATGAGTTVMIRNAAIFENQAVNQGGGIVAYQGASVVMDRVDGGCSDFVPRCSDLTLNSLTSGSLGAAAWAGAGANLTISQTYVNDNTIPIASPIGNVLYATGAGTTLTVEGVGMWNNNGPDALIEGRDFAVVHVAFVSATGNVYGEKGLPARPIALSDGATGTLGSSIFYPNSPAFGAGALSELDCLIVSDTSGLSGGDFISTADPLFLDPANGALHLPPNSPAVDYCDAMVTAPQHFDIDHEVRGFDMVANANGVPGVPGGVFDIGFDELRGLFGDGFESETTGPWSLTVP